MGLIVEFLQRCRDERAFSGAVYAFGTSSGLKEQGVLGTLAWDGEPVQADSLWDLASVTKPVAMLPLMQLLEQGELCLDDAIAYFLPEYGGTDKADITLRQLLTHSGGIPGQQPLYQTALTKEALLTAVKNLPLRSKPGTRVEYTSQGYMILGEIIGKAAGAGLDAVLQRQVFEPLGMNDTLFNPPADYVSRAAATEYCPWRGKLVQGEVHDENAVILGGVAGHAGLFSTVADMALLGQELLLCGQGDNGRLLRRSTMRLMARNHTSSLNLARGLGWQAKDAVDSPAGDLFSAASFGHTGFTGTSIWMDPEKDAFAVLLTNRVHPSRSNTAIKRIRTIFHNLVILTLEKQEAR